MVVLHRCKICRIFLVTALLCCPHDDRGYIWHATLAFNQFELKIHLSVTTTFLHRGLVAQDRFYCTVKSGDLGEPGGVCDVLVCVSGT